MGTLKHEGVTPGEWTASWNANRSWAGVDYSSDDDLHAGEICTVCIENIEIADEEQAWRRILADAHMLAAAKKLYEACQQVQQSATFNHVTFQGAKVELAVMPKAVYEAVCAAIKKAETIINVPAQRESTNAAG